MQPGSGSPGRGRLNWRQVGILYRRELRAALREKTIVINSILIPIFLYPFLLWVAFTGMTFVLGQNEESRSRIAARDWPKAHPGLRRSLQLDTQLEWIETQGSLEELERKINRGVLDAFVVFKPATGESAALTNNFQALITFDQSKERSAMASDRLKSDIDHYRSEWVKREARARGVEPAGWQVFALSTRNVASQKQMGSFLLGLMLPVIFVVMVAVGCFHPAVDALAGERERQTWETLMSTGANRLAIVVAKYLYVTSLGGLAGMLNLLAVVLTFKPILAPLLATAGGQIQSTLPLSSLPILALAGLLLAGFIAAGMMIFASFARTFKEGQAMITPFYMLVLIPVVFLQVPGLKLSPLLACLPIVNVTLMVREAISGTFHWPSIALTITVSIVMIALCIRLAAFILRFEDVVTGAYTGSLGRFLKERLFASTKPGRSGAEAAP